MRILALTQSQGETDVFLARPIGATEVRDGPRHLDDLVHAATRQSTGPNRGIDQLGTIGHRQMSPQVSTGDLAVG
jgi:hypothetical protein